MVTRSLPSAVTLRLVATGDNPPIFQLFVVRALSPAHLSLTDITEITNHASDFTKPHTGLSHAQT